jgi:two-component system, response regulator PdtaR
MLLGANVLIVEDEYLIALEIQRILEDAGTRPPDIVRSVTDAASRPQVETEVDLLILSIGAETEPAVAFAGAMRHAGAAVLLVSVESAHREGVPGLDGVETLVKPFTDAELIAAATAAILGAKRPVREGR